MGPERPQHALRRPPRRADGARPSFGGVAAEDPRYFPLEGISPWKGFPFIRDFPLEGISLYKGFPFARDFGAAASPPACLFRLFWNGGGSLSFRAVTFFMYTTYIYIYIYIYICVQR